MLVWQWSLHPSIKVKNFFIKYRFSKLMETLPNSPLHATLEALLLTSKNRLLKCKSLSVFFFQLGSWPTFKILFLVSSKKFHSYKIGIYHRIEYFTRRFLIYQSVWVFSQADKSVKGFPFQVFERRIKITSWGDMCIRVQHQWYVSLCEILARAKSEAPDNKFII